MTLKPGTMLGQYEIRELIGKGGMGEVYHGFDTKLKRDVALKVLPSEFARDPDRLARFRREATLLASLNHPHIAQIYGVEDSGETHALVIEYVPGETLQQQLLREGPLPVEEVLRIATQILEALEHAHDKAIIHRDLKPANVKLTPEGKVKVLDFGLAKAFAAGSADSAESYDSQSPTVLTASPTLPGVILGTAAYMSPEQARGKPVDKRTDIWAFGCVLYELLTGKQVFAGEDVTDIIAAIVKGEPDWTALPANTPQGIRVLLRRCLQKDKTQRLRDAGDVHIQIEEAAAAPAPAPVATPAPKTRTWLAWSAVALFLISTAALSVMYFRQQPQGDAIMRFSVVTPLTGNPLRLAISPDGRQLAFAGRTAEGGEVLWLRSLDSFTARPLAGTEGASGRPWWSPDSRFLAFGTEGKVKKVEVSTGAVQTVCDAPSPIRGVAWNREGVIIFGTATTGLYRVSAAGGQATALTTLDQSRQETFHAQPQFLPDGHHFLFFAASAKPENSGIYIGSLDSKESKKLLSTDLSAAYAPPGYLLFMREATLLAQPFDASRLELSGEPVLLAEGVRINKSSGTVGFSVSDNGLLAFRSGEFPNNRLAWFDRAGKALAQIGEPGPYDDPELSPDQKRLAVERQDADTRTWDIWLMDLLRGNSTRFTFDPRGDNLPIWSPDGSMIVFGSDRTGVFNLYQKLSSGAGNEDVLLQSEANKQPMDWSSDGRYLIYSNQDPKTARDLWVLPLFGDRKPFPYLQTQFEEFHARLSPDGRWLAYISNESGRYEVYVQSFPKPGGKWLISTNGGVQPRWRRDGKELFYIALDRKLMAVPVRGGTALETGTPVALFETRIAYGTTVTFGRAQEYDVTPDGQKFLINMESEVATTPPINVVVNWTASLKR